MPFYRIPVMQELDVRLNGSAVLVYSGTPIPGEKVNEIPDVEGVETRKLPFRSIPFPGKYSVGYLKGLTSLLDEIQPAVIVTEGESNFINNLLVYLYCRRHQIPYLWWSCGRVRHIPVSFLRKIAYPVLHFVLNRASAVIGYSRYACRYYQREYGIRPERTFFSPNSLLKSEMEKDFTLYQSRRKEFRGKLGIREDAPVILYVGAVVREKRPDLFLEIFRSLKKRFPGLHGIIVGDGNFLPEIRRRGDTLKDMHITGKAVTEALGYFIASDVYVMPGLGGLGLQQAMFCKKPVVCSVADGTELDLVEDGENGYFLEWDAPLETWEDKCSSILSDPELHARMGKKSRDIIEHEFNSDIMLDNIIRAIQYSTAER